MDSDTEKLTDRKKLGVRDEGGPMHSDMWQSIRRILWFVVFLSIGWAELVGAF